MVDEKESSNLKDTVFKPLENDPVGRNEIVADRVAKRPHTA